MKFSMSEALLSGWTIVVVDDEADSLFIAQTLLQMCGATVISANNGREGVKVIRQYRPNFVITDLSMPVMSGWQLLREVKEDVHTAEIPVIALTAHAMPGDRQRAIEVGFHNYLSKPLVPETFINNVLQLLLDVDELRDRLVG